MRICTQRNDKSYCCVEAIKKECRNNGVKYIRLDTNLDENSMALYEMEAY